ncbi:MAG: TrkH family potassium uptake protein [Clostridia bacterium]|nr:TrkH family potassium uptake protein [Clostridia bacterium]
MERFIPKKEPVLKKKMPIIYIFSLGYFSIITLGAILLMLPISTRGANLNLLEAYFTATSATCVTGLVIFDTYSKFTFFGQLIILILIQIGGLGFMTLLTALPLITGKRVKIRDRLYIQDSLSLFHTGGSVRILKRTIAITAFFEFTGSIILMTRFIPKFGVKNGIWMGIFHSISAFCNAGFDIMGRVTPFSSVTYFQNDIVVYTVLMTLIFCGGLGFIVWNEIIDKKNNFKKYTLHTRVMLVVSFALIFISAIVYFICDYNKSLKELPLIHKIGASFFQVITPRTAGFNLVPISEMSSASKFMTAFLMFVGAGTGSTGGGVKVTVFSIMVFSMISYFKRSQDVNIFDRRIEDKVIRKVFSSATIYLTLAVVGSFLIAAIEEIGVFDIVFEVFSALGTVGLTTGITAQLNSISKIILIILMFCGRVGSLTVFMTFILKDKKALLRYPTGKIMV